MWIANNWKDYQVLDTSNGEKLEKWGEYVLVRPDPQVIWDTPKELPEWKHPNAHYHRSSKGGGEWEFFNLPNEWQIGYGKLRFNLKPFSFKHTGLFPEQAVNWDWMSEVIRKRLINNKAAKAATTASAEVPGNQTTEVPGREAADVPASRPKILNLFAYTGGATLACVAAGAHVTHVDASKGMVGWAKENAASSALPEKSFRWIVDDCVKFVQREIRRGNRYDAIIMDPPSYGRGPGGEVWKIEESIYPLIMLCSELLSDDALFFLINSYTTGLQPGVLTHMIKTAIAKDRGGTVCADEIGLPIEGTDLSLPCGASGRWLAG